jgi:23S rRNA pseudouridine2605 synthase
MTDNPETGDRIAKVMARAGVASRRDAERLIVEGRVAVNGKTVTSPALDVLPTDKITLDGKPIDAPQPARLWLYYKPLGLVTSEHDEKGRQTVFESLPDGMPRVMSVGRLDLNSEGLLLLTNDGELKRRLELPATGWLRKYRVRVNGRPNEATFDPLRRGITIAGETFLPMDIILDRQQGANAWLTVGLREGKNREIRRAMAEVGLTVNRLIRVSYGPFRLNQMQPGDVVEVKQKVLREQLGEGAGERRKPRAPDTRHTPRRGARDGTEAPRRPRAPQGDRAADGHRTPRHAANGKPAPRRADDARPARADRPYRKPAPAQSGESPERRAGAADRSAGHPPARAQAGRPDRAERTDRGPRPPRLGADSRKPRTRGGRDAPGQEQAAGSARRREGDRPEHGGPSGYGRGAARGGPGGKSGPRTGPSDAPAPRPPRGKGTDHRPDARGGSGGPGGPRGGGKPRAPQGGGKPRAPQGGGKGRKGPKS